MSAGRRHRAGTSRGRKAGFTLIEILAALAILGTTLVVLLDSHYAALSLHLQTQDLVRMSGYLELAVGIAEVEVADPTQSALQMSSASDLGPLKDTPAQFMVAIGLAARGAADL